MLAKATLSTTIFLALTLAIVPVLADVTVSTPLASQLPAVGHVGSSYSWTFSDATFHTTGTAGSVTYSASGLPSWAHFDSASRTVTGTPSNNDVASSRVTIRAEDGSESAQDAFDLPVFTDPAPTLKKSLVDQLPTASSLGRSQILSGNKLHIPYGWSFSVGWQGDTFSLASGAQIYTMGTISGTKPLPSWLKYSPTTFAMWGIAPNVPPPEGTEFVFTLTGSNAEGHGGTQTNLTIVLGEGKLSVAKPGFTDLDVDSGANVSYALPLSNVLYDGSEVVDLSTLDVKVDTSSTPWLEYDTSKHVLSGVAPTAQGSSADPVKSTVPITIANSLGKKLTVNLPVTVYPPFFSNAILPNVFVESGVAFNVSLKDYIRNSDHANITAECDPSSAADWIKYNSTTMSLSGTPPQMGASDKVAVTLRSAAFSGSSASAPISSRSLARRADDDEGPSNAARFYVALNGSNPGTPTSPTHHSGGGLSNKGRTILAAVLGSVGGLIALIALVMLARRCCAVEDHDTQGNSIDDTRSPAMSDDRTLYGDNSPVLGGGVFKKNKIKEGASPAPDNSQFLHPKSAEQRAYQQKNGSELRGILIGGRNYGGNTPEMGEAEKPRQHGLMSALVAGARKKFPSTRSLGRDGSKNNVVSQSQSAGLGLTGLGLEAPESDDPYTQRPVRHSRSQFSLRSSASRESWEDDLFYQQQAQGIAIGDPSQTAALTPVIEVDEVPVRRGSTRISSRSSRNNPMRQRSAHTNASPAFAAPGTFANPTSDESSNGHVTSSQGHDNYDSMTEMPSTSSEQYVIGTAQRVDVRSINGGSVTSHQPDVRQSHHRSISSHATYEGDAAFEDAEDEEQLNGYPVQTQNAVRSSAVSAMTNDSHVQALHPYISYPDGQPAAASSPRPPSFLGGASITSSVRPEETLRAVKPSSTPAMPAQQAAPMSPMSNPHTPARQTPRPSRTVENLEANVCPGERLRIKLSPPGGPAMIGGAPGSPGKRSSRTGRYLPVLDDETMQANGTWPIWLSEWLHWDPLMFELSGEVPLDFELSPVHIALVHRRHTEPASPALGSVTPRRSHSRQQSNESATTAVDDEAVVRLTLWIEPSELPFGSGHVELRRDGTGTAF